MITPAALANFQRLVAAQFDRTGVIYRQDRTMDGAGHLAPVWQVQNGGAAIPCSLGRPAGGLAAAQGEELGSLNIWVLALPITTTINGVLTTVDLRASDRVVIGLDTVHVQNVDNLQQLPVVLTAKVTEVQWTPEDDPNG